jgi:ketosteroid isomerase-like protein
MLYMETLQENKTVTQQQRNAETTRRFIQLVEKNDIPAFLNLWAEDGVQFNYFQMDMLPPEIRGKKALREFWEPIPGRFSSMHFPIEAIFPMLDPQMVAVKYRGFTQLKESGADYNNEYFAIFVFNKDGKIKEYHEYSNPVITAISFQMTDKIFPRNENR